jgi:SAM-dependent methyltransferase
MNDPVLQPRNDAAEAYEEFFVPALFRPWAARVADAARLGPGQRVLDVACGTGILAREAAARVAPGGSVAALDADPGMLAVAARLEPKVEWRRGTAESLPYPDGSFDAVVSQFGLMFFTDRRRALREMLRVLAPGGHVAVAVWDSLGNTPAYTAVVALLERFAGQRAADGLRAPFVLGDRNELATLFASAGLPQAEITTHTGTAQFSSIRSMVEANIKGLSLMGIVLPEEQIDHILEEAEHVLSPYVTSEGSVRFDSPAHIVTGTKP